MEFMQGFKNIVLIERFIIKKIPIEENWGALIIKKVSNKIFKKPPDTISYQSSKQIIFKN